MTEPEKPAETSQTNAGGWCGDPRKVKRFEQVAKNAPSRLQLFRRVYEGKASARQSIKAFCLECLGFDERLIRECTGSACPLYRLRPYQRQRTRNP